METLSPVLITFLVNSLWQITLIAGAAWLASMMLRDNPASHRHTIWIAALIASVALPIASVRSVSSVERTRHLTPGAPQFSPADPSGATPAAAAPKTSVPVQRQVEFGRAAALSGFVLYLLFVAIRIARLLTQAIRTSRIRRDSQPIEATGALRSAWTRAARGLQAGDIELRVSDLLPGPVTAGALRKTIILPRQLAMSDSEAVLTAAIGHEMAHIARRDYMVNILCEILWLPIAFQPASWLIRRGIARTREIATDELVARELLDGRIYAEAIFSIAAGMFAPQRPGFALGVFDGDILEERIRILTRGRRIDARRAAVLFATAAGGLLACLIYVSGLAIPARAQSPALSEIKQGVDAYNSGYYAFAQDHFQKAVDLDPNNVNARLFLATALFRTECANGGPNNTCPPVVEQYQQVLERDPLNPSAIFGITTLTGAKHPKEAHALLMKLLAADPNNKEAYYAVAVIDWREAFMGVQAALQQANLPRSTARVPDPGVRQQLRTAYGSTIEEGQKFTQAALKIDPEYSNAMAYSNLLYRLQSAIVESAEGAETLLASADTMVEGALRSKRMQAGEPAGPAPLSVDRPPDAVAYGPILVTAPLPPPPPKGN